MKDGLENIDELVLDLRYNGGGRVDTAQILASYIAGDNAVGADAAKLIYNNKNSDSNKNTNNNSCLSKDPLFLSINNASQINILSKEVNKLQGLKKQVDGMDNRLEKIYEARPERFYVLEKFEGNWLVRWRSGIGPFDYKPEEFVNFFNNNDFVKDY